MARVFHSTTPKPASNKKGAGPKEVKKTSEGKGEPEKNKNNTASGEG